MTSWPAPPTQLRLEHDEVHLWRVALNISTDKEPLLRSLLSEDELLRADRFRFDQHRQRFIMTRASLRRILGDYLSINPASLVFQYGPHGKPFLVLPERKMAINFNVSHSGNIALYAFAKERQLGIDIEAIREKTDYMAICKNWFTANEQAILQACPEDQRRQCFFRGWTRKEAYLKALGEGIAYGLNRFEISLQENNAALLWHKDDEKEIRRWRLMEISVDADYYATLAVEGQNWQARYFSFPEK